MKARYLDNLIMVLKYTAMLAALAYVVLFVVIAVLRIGYPFELEWAEGACVDHVNRVLSGQPLYVAPTIEFTPFHYPPLYFYLSALVAGLTGIGFLPLRLISFLSTVACFVLIFQFARRETNSNVAGLLAAGFFAATFELSGAWFDIARVDMLFLALVIASVYLLRFGSGDRSLVLAAFLMYLAFMTKQSALFIAALLSLHGLLTARGWRRILFPAVFVLLVGGTTLVLSVVTDGWFYYYMFDLPRQHEMVPAMFLGFWREDMPHVIIAFALSLAYLVYTSRKKEASKLVFYVIFIGCMMANAWLARMHSGTWLNGLLPAHFALAVLFGLAIHASLADVGPKASRTVALLAIVLCNVQFVSMVYRPQPHLPTATDEQAGYRFIEALRQIDGDLFMSYPGFLPFLAGKKVYSDGGAMADIFRGTDEELKTRLRADINAQIRNRRFNAIIISIPWFGFYINSPTFVAEVEKYYDKTKSFFDDSKIFTQVTGVKTRPATLYTAKPVISTDISAVPPGD